jgi:hypothetical protein
LEIKEMHGRNDHGAPFVKMAYTFPLDRGVRQSSVELMGFNRRNSNGTGFRSQIAGQ